MIPVLGVPILSTPQLLGKMLASIDTDVGRLIVVDNGDVIPPVVEKIEVIRPGKNLGVAASWNLVIRSAPEAPWWMLSGFDLIYAPGDLDRLTEHMNQHNDEPMVAMLGTFSAFAINRHAIKKAGWFDENFHPAYYEDNDYNYRCQLTDVPIVALPAGLYHRVSSTINSHPILRRENDRTFPFNTQYYLDKWGGPPRREQYETPFKAGGSPSHWDLDQERLNRLAWRRV
jgi:GT2 family glycosyltransferase